MIDQQVPATSPKPDYIPQGEKKVDTEFSKHITATSFMEAVFNKKLCGWREITREENIRETPFGTDSIAKKEWLINSATRLCNEDCSSYCRSSIEGAINHLTQTGKLTDLQIYNEWNILHDDIFDSLEDNFADDNSWAIKDYGSYTAIPRISIYCLSWWTVTNKCLNGFTLEEIAESQLTQNIIRTGGELPIKDKNSGILGVFGNLFGRNKQVQ